MAWIGIPYPNTRSYPLPNLFMPRSCLILQRQSSLTVTTQSQSVELMERFIFSVVGIIWVTWTMMVCISLHFFLCPDSSNEHLRYRRDKISGAQVPKYPGPVVRDSHPFNRHLDLMFRGEGSSPLELLGVEEKRRLQSGRLRGEGCTSDLPC